MTSSLKIKACGACKGENIYRISLHPQGMNLQNKHHQSVHLQNVHGVKVHATNMFSQKGHGQKVQRQNVHWHNVHWKNIQSRIIHRKNIDGWKGHIGNLKLHTASENIPTESTGAEIYPWWVTKRIIEWEGMRAKHKYENNWKIQATSWFCQKQILSKQGDQVRGQHESFDTNGT